MASTYQGRRPASRKGGKGGRGKNSRGGARTVALRRSAPVVREPVTLPGVLTIGELAEKLETTGVEVIKELMKVGMMATINQQIDYATAARVAEALGWETLEEESALAGEGEDFEARRIEAEADPNARPRPPVVTIMGHV
ncbi:MAG: translation initiation factor IF-2 N-terminal domain-containing protein, partial [Thermomicrobiales bacterium]|nr:translation initiation factor IF-2 N-terminal domain-containing protein [Thermomicrobiales bacterium]